MRETLQSSARDRKPPKVLEDIRIKKGENGGHVIEHHFTSYEHKPEVYPFGAGQGKEAAAHLNEHMGMELPAGEAESEPEKK
jgi:hypothetical protein